MHIAFIGLGNMGGPMALNLQKAGHDVRAFDLSADALARAEMVLRAHRSAVEVAVWEHERPVGTRGRSAVR